MSGEPQLTGTGSALFDASPLPLLVVDADSLRVLAANTAAIERYGYERKQLLELRLTDLTDPTDTPRLVSKTELSDGHTVLAEVQRHRRRDGTVFPAHCATREFELAGKRVLIISVTEMSELRPMQAEERFIEKMDALARLGGGIAHEFNNLLTAILATADLALDTPEIAASVREDLQSIRVAGQRAAAITRQLLAFSGNQSVSLRQTNLNQLIEQLSALLRQMVPDAISLTYDLRSAAAVEVDPARLEQAILNLVLNAVDAMPNGGVLTLRTEDAGAVSSVIVSDSGQGIDEITLARLFEPFNSTKGLGGGRGLGLASVYGTVRAMRGSAEVESAPGGGTSVRLTFPSTTPAIDLDFVSVAPPRDATGGEVVIVVEDEPAVRAPICRTLRNLGYFVLEADNGAQALEVMQQHHSPVHLVISDVMMPEMDGTELVALLRSWYPAMRVLFISGYSPQYLEGIGGKTRVNGAHFLAKPFGLDVLGQRVREILDSEWTEELVPEQ